MAQVSKGWRGGKIVAFVDGVEFEHAAQEQVNNIASLSFIHEHVAIMPDVHYGRGATVGSVIPTHSAIIPAAVGVDLGCGMMAIRTSIRAEDLPDSLANIRFELERVVPHGGFAAGEWTSRSGTPQSILSRWRTLEDRFDTINKRTPEGKFDEARFTVQLGTLGGGNHFVELCLDEEGRVWIMLHSGSRGVGNRIGQYFIERARKELAQRDLNQLPDKDLAWFNEGTDSFSAYVEAISWAQDYALENRKAMMENVLRILRAEFPGFTTEKMAINCHHNYAVKERHFGSDVWITRKGAVSAKKDELGIIPGSMGAKSFIVRGKGNPDSFCSCSHGAGRKMSRGEAKRTFTVQDHVEATRGVECKKDASVIDETPGAYKDIDAVIAAQSELIEVVHTLKQVLCIKG